MDKYTFNATDIFEEIEGDPENVIMKFPQEIIDKTGWQEGDCLNIKLENGAIVVTKA